MDVVSGEEIVALADASVSPSEPAAKRLKSRTRSTDDVPQSLSDGVEAELALNGNFLDPDQPYILDPRFLQKESGGETFIWDQNSNCWKNCSLSKGLDIGATVSGCDKERDQDLSICRLLVPKPSKQQPKRQRHTKPRMIIGAPHENRDGSWSNWISALAYASASAGCTPVIQPMDTCMHSGLKSAFEQAEALGECTSDINGRLLGGKIFDVLAWYPWIYTQRIRHGIANFDQKPTHYYDYCNHTLEKGTAMELPHAYSETWNPVKELKATRRRRSTCRSVVAIPKSHFADARTCERQTAGLVAGLCRQDNREQSED